MLDKVHEFLQNLIDVPAWNKAKWIGTGFIMDSSDSQSPYLVLAFTDEAAAKDIFAGFRERIGRSDEDNLIRISIIEGTIQGNPHAYAVHVSPHGENILSHFEVEPDKGEQIPVAMISRIHRMNPAGPSQALFAFKRVFSHTNQFTLIPATIRNGGMVPYPEMGISKKEIFFRRMEDIGDNDPDAPALEGR
jgi:hypothetical protein